jgi:phage nucleotide-binding protein
MTTVLTERSIGGLPIQKIQERADYKNFLIYGEPGIGKTVLSGSMDEVPSCQKVLMIDAEGGSESLRRTYPNVAVVRVKTFREVLYVYDDLQSGQFPEIKTVLIDSLTEVQKFSMYDIMQDLILKEPGRDPDIPSVREWGKNIEQIRKLVRAFRDLPMNVVFTSLAASEKNAKTGVITKKPSLSGKMANEVAGFLDIVCYMYVKEIPDPNDSEKMVSTRLLLTGATEEYIAKDRTGKLPLVVSNPTMKLLYEIIDGKPQEEEVQLTES